jgi:pimeloyl-ACP methyl ester carboxylesterase
MSKRVKFYTRLHLFFFDPKLMAPIKKLFRGLYRLLLPIVLLVFLSLVGSSIWLAHTVAKPGRAPYLVTPEEYARLSTRGAKITEENWPNPDGTTARGWLLRGTEGKPGVLLLHRFGADRSWVLNLGVKINEETNFTVLMPDLRAHGESASLEFSGFGYCETSDFTAAVAFLRGLKEAEVRPLVGQNIGAYGVELGAYAAAMGASSDPTIRALVLDSVPLESDDLLAATIEKRFPFASMVSSELAKRGAQAYLRGCYKNVNLCAALGQMSGRRVLLLGGADSPRWQSSTNALGKCLPQQELLEAETNLPAAGMTIVSTPPEPAAVYDQRIVDFFKKKLD